MPEEQHAMGTAEKTRAVDHVSAAVEQRPEYEMEILGVVFEVGILHHDVWVSRGGESESERGALALVDGVEQAMNVRMLQAFEIVASAVLRSVVDYDHLGVKATIE